MRGVYQTLRNIVKGQIKNVIRTTRRWSLVCLVAVLLIHFYCVWCFYATVSMLVFKYKNILPREKKTGFRLHPSPALSVTVTLISLEGGRCRTV